MCQTWTNVVVSNMAFIFNNIWDVILPIDELIFFKMVKTTNQINMGVSINGYPNSWILMMIVGVQCCRCLVYGCY